MGAGTRRREVPVSAMALWPRETNGGTVELVVVLVGLLMEKPVASNCQKPAVALTGTKEMGPVNSVGSMKPKL
jgi:hypothetical protein